MIRFRMNSDSRSIRPTDGETIKIVPGMAARNAAALFEGAGRMPGS